MLSIIVGLTDNTG